MAIGFELLYQSKSAIAVAQTRAVSQKHLTELEKYETEKDLMFVEKSGAYQMKLNTIKE